MYINTYNLTGQALQDAWAHNMRQEAADQLARIRNTPWRVAIRRIVACLAIRRGPNWLDVHEGMLESYMPTGWQAMPLWRIIEHIDTEDIGPLNCVVSE